MTGEEEFARTLDQDHRRVRTRVEFATLSEAIDTTTPARQLSPSTADKIAVARRSLSARRPKCTAAATIGGPRATLFAHLGRLE